MNIRCFLQTRFSETFFNKTLNRVIFVGSLCIYLFLALISPAKICILIHANKKLHYINVAKHTAEITK